MYRVSLPVRTPISLWNSTVRAAQPMCSGTQSVSMPLTTGYRSGGCGAFLPDLEAVRHLVSHHPIPLHRPAKLSVTQYRVFRLWRPVSPEPRRSSAYCPGSPTDRHRSSPSDSHKWWKPISLTSSSRLALPQGPQRAPGRLWPYEMGGCGTYFDYGMYRCHARTICPSYR